MEIINPMNCIITELLELEISMISLINQHAATRTITIKKTTHNIPKEYSFKECFIKLNFSFSFFFF